MWDLPRDQLWMALPFWEKLKGEHAGLLEQEALRLWLAIAASVKGECIPFSRLLFHPDEALSSLSIEEGPQLDRQLVDVGRTRAQLGGTWFAEFDRKIIVALGAGTATLQVVGEGASGEGYGRAQRGFVMFGVEPAAHGWIRERSLRQVFELTGQSILSPRAMLVFADFNRVDPGDFDPDRLSMGPAGSVAFRTVGLATPRLEASVAPSRPAMFLHAFGLQKLGVVRLLMRDLNASAGEVAARVGDLARPFQVARADQDEIDSILDLADEYAAAGAVVRVGPEVNAAVDAAPATA